MTYIKETLLSWLTHLRVWCPEQEETSLSMNTSAIRTAIPDSLQHEIIQLPAILLLINVFITQASASYLRRSRDIWQDETNRTQSMAGFDYTRPLLSSRRQNYVMYLLEGLKMWLFRVASWGCQIQKRMMLIKPKLLFNNNAKPSCTQWTKRKEFI